MTTLPCCTDTPFCFRKIYKNKIFLLEHGVWSKTNKKKKSTGFSIYGKLSMFSNPYIADLFFQPFVLCTKRLKKINEKSVLGNDLPCRVNS